MARLVILSAAEQVAAHLRGELLAGAWSGLMPGGDRMAADLGVGKDTVEAALKQLEAEGLLINQGRRRGRRIVLPEDMVLEKRLRLGILLDEQPSRRQDYFMFLEHELGEAGHRISYPPQSMLELGMDLNRISAMVGKAEVDGWLVLAGSREVLEWFSAGDVPVLAIFGRRRGLRVAGVGPDKVPAMAAATRRLITLGHRRIVLLARRVRRVPVPGAVEQAFMNELAAHGIEPGSFHLPDWEETVDGFHKRLDSLFRVTRPTALIVDEVPFFLATQQFLSRQRLRVPEEVSLICTDGSPDFDWYQPKVAHIRWDSRPLVRRVLQWAGNVSRGKKDLRQTFTPAEFVTGGTTGSVRA
jgi:biotin operon repressor